LSLAFPTEINVGLLGLGVVGGGVAASLLEHSDVISGKIGRRVSLKKVLVRDPGKPRDSKVAQALLTTNPGDILSNPEIHVLVEVIGGTQPAFEYLKQALSAGKHVVTANKEVMAKHGLELLALADENRVNLLFEASVGGGIPIVGSLTNELAANDVRSIRSIINGTTNYILTQMAYQGTAFHRALKEAQELGYAEADPTNDVEGFDAAYKIGILASIAFHQRISVEDVYRQGISALEPQDFRYAQELGYAIKPLAIAALEDGAVGARVYPALVPVDHMLAKVDGVYNAVEVEGSLCGKVLFHGMGAGREPTTSSVIGDLIAIGRTMASRRGLDPAESPNPQGDRPQDYSERRAGGEPWSIRPIDDLTCKYYLRLNVADQPGVLALIAQVLGDGQISIASVLQKTADPTEQTAEIVITTHPSREASVQKSLRAMAGLTVVRKVNNLLRIED
jgi:homoserine dehydrogenase